MNESLFGTDGIRARIGTSPLTLEMLIAIGRTLGAWIVEQYGPMAPLLIASDTRISASFVKTAIKSGLLLSSVHVYDGNILSTPNIIQLVQKQALFVCGIIISASHNPFYDNGIKIVTQSGKLSLNEEKAISELMNQYTNTASISYQTFGIDETFQEARKLYHSSIVSYFPTPFLHGKKVVLDCAHGANYEIAPLVFKDCGAEVITLNDKPNGTNINNMCGSLHPTILQNAVHHYQADIGFSFDGDGDRVIAVARNGHIKDGDQLLALLLDHPVYQEQKAVVGTIMTNGAFESFLNQHDKALIRTDVGDKQVSHTLQEKGLLMGGEPAGHIILRDYLDSGDGIFAALRIAEVVTLTHNWDMETFEQHPQIHISIPITQKKDLAEPGVSAIINKHTKQLQNGRLIVRYSGTENILRIMAEDNDDQHAQSVAHALSQELQNNL